MTIIESSNHKVLLFIIILFHFLSPVFPQTSSLPVLPGAIGFGSTTVAGRGGQVLKVINLNPSGPGSLHAAVSASGPRVVVFEVSGTIRITSDMVIQNPYITIAGQTAPSPGIMIRGAALTIATHDVLVQHIRVRAGDDSEGPAKDNRDALKIDNCCRPTYNVVIDHCSFSWSVDENVSIWNSGLYNVAFLNSISSEGLYIAGHPGYPPGTAHSKGFIIGPGITKVSVYGNLFAHNHQRNIKVGDKSTKQIEQVNNLIYNWGSTAADTEGDLNVIGNHFISGQNTTNPSLLVRTADARMYAFDNMGGTWWPGSTGTPNPVTQSSIPAERVMPSSEVYDYVLDNAGARPADRDPVDTRIIQEVRTRTGSFRNTVQEAGGWPELAHNIRKVDSDIPGIGAIPANTTIDSNGNGYSDLEEWLHALAAQVEGKEPAPEIVLVTENDSIQNKWLIKQGFKVKKYYPSAGLANEAEENIKMLNDADLVIIGNDVKPADFGAPDNAAWNSLAVPLLLNSAICAKKDYLNWFSTNSHILVESDVLINVRINTPEDTIFTFVTFTGDHIEWTRGPTVLLTSSLLHNGQIIASYQDDPVVVRWPASTEFYPLASTSANGERTYFGMGYPAEGMPLTKNGQAAYLAEISRLIKRKIKPPVQFNSDTTLAALAANAGILSPAFNPAISTYSLYLPAGLPQVQIQALPAGTGASVTGTGVLPNQPGLVTLKVTAEDGTIGYYTIALSQAEFPDLSKIEAESGILVTPMQKVADANASGGYFIRTTTNFQGTATYYINITETGDYKMTYRVFAVDDGSNSFFVRINNEPEFQTNISSQFWGAWNNVDVTNLQLEEGVHSFTFRGRESNTRMDYFYLTRLTTTKTNESVHKNKLVFYPNPAISVLHIEGIKEKVTLELFDLQGRKIDLSSEEVMLPYNLDLKSLNKGIYIIKVHSNNEIFMERMIKQ
jgi:hypothetical protein